MNSKGSKKFEENIGFGALLKKQVYKVISFFIQ